MINKTLPNIMIVCLLGTIIIELLISIILKIKDKKDFINIILVNILTNPLLVSISTLILYKYGLTKRNISVIIMEVMVVIIEGYIYKKYIKYEKINPFLLSLILNASSYFIGGALNNIIYRSDF